jgi:hypothetical protein
VFEGVGMGNYGGWVLCTRKILKHTFYNYQYLYILYLYVYMSICIFFECQNVGKATTPVAFFIYKPNT